MTRVGLVTGLRAEARIIEKALARQGDRRAMVGCAGLGGERARRAAEDLLGQGAQLLISFGLCGGLDPALRAGELIAAERVLLDDGRALACAEDARSALAGRLEDQGLRIAGGNLLGRDAPAAAAAEKAALFGASGARALDMESHGVALAAAEAGVPLLVLRAVADPAGRNLPRAALKAVGPDGRLRLWAMIATMYLRPWESPGLVRLAYEARLGFDALERVAGAPGALLGGD